MMKSITLSVLLILATLIVKGISEIPVDFTSGKYEIQGTLTLPEGNGPFAAAILVHGSGPNDRDQTIILKSGNAQCLYPGLYGDTVKNFRDIAQELAKKGMAVLRYDKRTHTYKTQIDPKKITPYDFIRDLNQAVEFLKKWPGTDPDRIVLIGHSQGANFIPVIAHQQKNIFAMISLAGAARPIDSIIADQVYRILARCYDSATGEDQREKTFSTFQKVRNGTWSDNTPIMGAYPQFWRSWINLTDSAVIYYRMNSIPTLFLQGNRDHNVGVKNALRFKRKLPEKQATVYILDQINHLFTDSSKPRVPSMVIDTIFTWLTRKQIAANTEQTHPSREELPFEVIRSQNSFEIKVHGTLKKMIFLDSSGKVLKTWDPVPQTIPIPGSFTKNVLLIKAWGDSGYFSKKVLLGKK